MGTAQNDIQEINMTIENAKANIAAKERLDNLSANEDFKKIVLEGYFKENAQRLVMLRSDPSFQGEDQQRAVMKAIDAIGEFRLYLNGIIQFGLRSAESLGEHEQTREEILEENLES